MRTAVKIALSILLGALTLVLAVSLGVLFWMIPLEFMLGVLATACVVVLAIGFYTFLEDL